MERISLFRVGWIVAALTMTSGCAGSPCGRLAGFQISRHWAEQTCDLQIEPGVRIHINAPSPDRFDRSKPTRIIFYALPNGNTIEWTIGRQQAGGLDWHYFIQHIGAQTRRLREIIQDRNIIVAYLETEQKSWPSWRAKYTDNSERIAGFLSEVRRQIGVPNTEFALSCHSGGGSFIFGYLNGVEQIPDDINRIAFLDANYGFSADAGHGTKLLDWLERSKDHVLVVIAYDDREITLDGKKVVGPDGGTYRATHRMLDAFRSRVELTETSDGDLVRYRGLDGRLDIIVHQNPENRILHTVLVGEMNGFIYAMTSGMTDEGQAAIFGGPPAYTQWIQPD